MQNPNKALEAIEILAGGDIGMDLEFYLADDRIKKKDKLLVKAAHLVTNIYKIAHAEGRCRHVDWENIKYKVITDPGGCLNCVKELNED